MSLLQINADHSLNLRHAQWSGFRMDGLRPALTLDGRKHVGVFERETQYDRGVTMIYRCGPAVRLTLEFTECGPDALALHAVLSNGGQQTLTLNDVALLESAAPGTVCFGADPGAVRMLVQSHYGGDIVPLPAEPAPAAQTPQGEPNVTCVVAAPPALRSGWDIWVAFDRAQRQALLAGFETNERWQGRIETESDAAGAVLRWAIGFDGGDLAIAPGEEVGLEDVVLRCGPEPWALLVDYADAVQARHKPWVPERPPVSWCSWYPYRLGVTEERILDTARIAARRLKPLGFRIVEVDLGWEHDHLPCAFEPNAKFEHGLAWLAGEVRKLGLELGVWKAPYAISEFHAVAREHPDWLIHDEHGTPVSDSIWFWEPHGKTYMLDLTCPGAQDWLRENVRRLHQAGVTYFKTDFIGVIRNLAAKRRQNRRIVSGGGVEAGRIGAEIIREELPGALMLNCGGPEMPGRGQWPLLYACNDTGNTGFLSWDFMRGNFRTVACHLFKNGRWGIIQPSCLCVGLPGGLAEARVRATVAFLAGGQIDISDTLTTLPEDRWHVLEATLPPLGKSARPVDLFEPLYGVGQGDYEAVCRGQAAAAATAPELPAGSVWHLRVDGDWDKWDLVALFAWDAAPGSARPAMASFAVPFERLGLPPTENCWAFEFWSGQFLGAVPGGRRNPAGYVHPGDSQDLLMPGPQGELRLGFAGPGVKLICLRAARAHPWVVGTSFHQGCGTELRDVRWEAASRTLSGVLMRPPGETGHFWVAAAGWPVARAEVAGLRADPMPVAHGAVRLAVVTRAEATPWKVVFGTRDTG